MYNKEALLKELQFKAIRSSGSGGQHVNKVASKIELSFNLDQSLVFSEDQKQRLALKLQSRLTKHGVLILHCDESRSQHKNKSIVIRRFLELIRNALLIRRRRVPTKIPKSVIRKRLRNKRKLAEKKANRRRPNLD
ncbi:alternative ribosome rescue aminoacyl-tRNA hydrolase ArfB [Seonamhaeicola sp. MEBiC1930]|uniref:alternative ribosome rescue aminoacyl-tRNA hydrolase ArfB n=1 Tax=Seonamhaeicola sp. MEBiC01930 TaxID=2976768 RepID=UPI0032432F7C